jgi:hypothetical protein
MTPADTEDLPPSEDDATSAPMTRVERTVAALLGTAALGGGAIAVFVSENELGTAALLIAGLVFLIMAVAATVPTRLRWGQQEVSLERIAVRHLIEGAPLEVQAEIIAEAMAPERRTPERQTVDGMLRRFARYSGSANAQVIHDEFVARGWTPSTPLKSTYILWRYRGNSRVVALYQNNRALVATSQGLKEFAANLPLAVTREPKGEVDVHYLPDPSSAVLAIEAITRFADNSGEATSASADL